MTATYLLETTDADNRFNAGEVLTKSQFFAMVGESSGEKILKAASQYHHTKLSIKLNERLNLEICDGVIALTEASAKEIGNSNCVSISFSSEQGFLYNEKPIQFSHPAQQWLWEKIKSDHQDLEEKIENWAKNLALEKHIFLERFLDRFLIHHPNLNIFQAPDNNDKQFTEETDIGSVYILMNPSMPGIVKIGKTNRSAEERATELSSSTGVPLPFIVAYEASFANCQNAEKYVHQYLEKKGYRVSSQREFFELPLKDAVDAVIEAKNNLPSSKECIAEHPPSVPSPFDEIDEFIDQIFSVFESTVTTPGDDLFQEAEAYRHGLGDEFRDPKKAIEYYEKAIQFGSRQSYRKLGEMFEMGEGVQINLRTATNWYKEGGANGAYDCYPKLANIYQQENSLDNAKKCWDRYFSNVDCVDIQDVLEYLIYFGCEYGIDESYRNKILEVIEPLLGSINKEIKCLNADLESLPSFENLISNNDDDFRVEGDILLAAENRISELKNISVQAVKRQQILKRSEDLFNAFHALRVFFPDFIVDDEKPLIDHEATDENYCKHDQLEAIQNKNAPLHLAGAQSFTDQNLADVIQFNREGRGDFKPSHVPVSDDQHLDLTNQTVNLVFPVFSIGTLSIEGNSQAARNFVPVSIGDSVILEIAEDIDDFSFLQTCDPKKVIRELNLSYARFFNNTQIAWLRYFRHINVLDLSQERKQEIDSQDSASLTLVFDSAIAFNSELRGRKSQFFENPNHDATSLDFSFLTEFKNLLKLRVYNRVLNSEALRVIGSIDSIESLEVYNDNGINYEILSEDYYCLSGLVNLRVLNLSGHDKLEGAMLVKIVTNLPNLQQLIIRKVDINPNQIDSIRQNRPALVVIHESFPKSKYPY